jgi:hypothetical protein
LWGRMVSRMVSCGGLSTVVKPARLRASRTIEWPADSGSLPEHGTLQRLRHFDCDKAAGGVEVVLATLVNDTKVPILGRVRVWNNRIDLMQFQGRLVIGVVYANHKSWG